MSVDINKTKPVILSVDAVKQILRDGKLTIRRPVRMSEPPRNIEGETYTPEILDDWTWCWKVDQYRNTYDGHAIPPYFPGETLYVKESWQTTSVFVDIAVVVYKAGGRKLLPDHVQFKTTGKKSWNSPISMPKEIARLFLKVISVRMEQTQDESAKSPWVWVIDFERIVDNKTEE